MYFHLHRLKSKLHLALFNPPHKLWKSIMCLQDGDSDKTLAFVESDMSCLSHNLCCSLEEVERLRWWHSEQAAHLILTGGIHLSTAVSNHSGPKRTSSSLHLVACLHYHTSLRTTSATQEPLPYAWITMRNICCHLTSPPATALVYIRADRQKTTK